MIRAILLGVALLPSLCHAASSSSEGDTTLVLDTELRVRSEWRDGYRLSSTPDEEGTLTTVQRSRIGISGGWDRLSFKAQLQDVRVYGQPGGNTQGNIAVAEAWGAYRFNPALSVKVGRQMVDFDGGRVVGAANWANPGRFLDGIRLDRQGTASRTSILYTWDELAETQRFIAHHEWFWERHRLALFSFDQSSNTELQAFTSGATWHWSPNDTWTIRTEGHLQWQEGDGSGHLIASEAARKAENGSVWKIGGDMLSDVQSGQAFQPLLGTNHKFYGWMDHFYVGAFTDGLTDLRLTRQFPIYGPRMQAGATAHHFRTYGGGDLLGNELDLWMTGKEQEGIRWFVGWSVFDPTTNHVVRQGNLSVESIEAAASRIQQWGWISVQINPSIALK